MTGREYAILAGIGLAACLLMLAASGDSPGYTDAFYYYNAGEQLASGNGLTDPYIWVYVNAPDEIPAASHRYWMPLASIVAAIPMAIFGTGYTVAQVAFIPFVIGLSLCGMWLGWCAAQKKRIAWVAGLSVLAGGFYLPFWLATDNFALYGCVGAVSLIAMGVHQPRWYVLAGVMAALGHLTRADGLLLLLVGIWIIITRREKRWQNLGALVGAYLLVMLPWMVRNIATFDAPLPTGGIGTAFLTDYDDLFSFPAAWSLADLLESGTLLQSRWDGLLGAFGTWLAVENFIVLAPFALWAAWQRRNDHFWQPMLWYALGLHLAMSLVFTHPGIRGALFHSSAALFPFWIALGLVGLDAGVLRLAKMRGWRRKQAQTVFGIAVVFVPLLLGISRWVPIDEPDYQSFAQDLPADARIMVNDPAAWYFHTGLSGIVIPDEPLDTALELAQDYDITHLVVDQNVPESFKPLLDGDTPVFLTEVASRNDDVRIYAFTP